MVSVFSRDGRYYPVLWGTMRSSQLRYMKNNVEIVNEKARTQSHIRRFGIVFSPHISFSMFYVCHVYFVNKAKHYHFSIV